MAIDAAKVIFILVGLYLVVINLYDMIRDPVPTNIGYQAVSLAIGGGLISYGLSIKPITQSIDVLLGGIKDAVTDAIKAATKVVGGPRP